MKNASEVRTLKAILNDIEKWRKEKHIKKTELAAAIGMTERNFRRLLSPPGPTYYRKHRFNILRCID